MKRLKTILGPRKRRKGAIAAMTGFLLLAIIGLVACALDIGWIAMTRTQLQAVADASSLAGGTELKDGLGYFKTKEPKEVADAATTTAVEFAGYNRNAELASSFVSADRDVDFGKATYDGGCGCWKKTPASENPKYYNYVEVHTLRNQAGSSNGDGPLSLFFARIFGIDEKSLRASATAAILPAGGFHIEEGSDDKAPVAPFAFNKALWDRFERAQKYYKDHPTLNLNNANTLKTISDPNSADPQKPEPLFGGYDDTNKNGKYDSGNEFVQLFFDDYKRTDEGAVSHVSDGQLEANIYPQSVNIGGTTSGNFGTIDYGGHNNSTDDLKRQISEGLSEEDLAEYDNEIVMPFSTGGDTGISSGMQPSLKKVVGQCKAIALYTTVTDPGNNANFTLAKFTSATVVNVNLNGSSKELRVQPCRLVDENAVPDTSEGDMDPNQTMFTPLILIR